MESWCRWARNSALHRTRLRLSKKFREERSDDLTSRKRGTAMFGSLSEPVKRCRYRNNWTGICGKVQRHGVLTRTMYNLIIGTGSESTAPAKRSITERTRWTYAGGPWASIIRRE